MNQKADVRLLPLLLLIVILLGFIAACIWGTK